MGLCCTLLLSFASLAATPVSSDHASVAVVVSTSHSASGLQHAGFFPAELTDSEQFESEKRRHVDPPQFAGAQPCVQCGVERSGALLVPRETPFTLTLRAAISIGLSRGPPAQG